MKQALTSQKIKEFALQQGMDMAGVAAVQAISQSVPPRPATDILPSARSVVVLAMRILRGTVESPNPRVTFAGINATLGQLDRAVLNLGRLIEDHGYRATILTTGMPAEMNLETRGLVGEISMKHAAAAAGLGVIGTSKILLTPKWGPRVRLAGLLTDAELEPDKPLEVNYCAGCNLCSQACPAGAIAENGNMDVNKCMRNSLKYGLGSFIRFATGLIGKPAEEIQKQVRDPYFWNLYQAAGFRTLYTCFECIKVCPAGENK